MGANPICGEVSSVANRPLVCYEEQTGGRLHRLISAVLQIPVHFTWREVKGAIGEGTPSMVILSESELVARSFQRNTAGRHLR